MDADGISYLDLSDAFRRHDWHNFLNAYWSPLYPMLLGLTRAALPGADKRGELVAAHALNFLIYAAALGCFEFFYAQLVRLSPSRELAIDDWENLGPSWEFWILAHAIFLWGSLDLITVWGVSPDLLVSVFIYAIAGLLLRFRPRPRLSMSIVLGVVLATSYWAKAVMFPLTFVFMGIALLSVNNLRTAIKCGMLMMLVFAVFAGPLVAALSNQKHRLTFGDSGRINYAMIVSPGGMTRDWQGEPRLGITAAHPTRKVFLNPPVYEFAEPIGGTFPPWYDPSYWEEGRVPRFNLKAQVAIILGHLLSYLELFLHQENALLASFVALVLLSRRRLLASFAGVFPLIAMCIAALVLYALVHVENRFIGGYVVVLWIALFSSFRVPSSLSSFSRYLLLGVSAALLITAVEGTAKAVKDGGPYSALQDVVLSDRLESLDVRAGDRIAVVGDGGFYAARLSHLRIVAEVAGWDTPQFWQLNADGKQKVYQTFAKCGAGFLLAPSPGPSVTLDPGWTKIHGTSFYLRKL